MDKTEPLAISIKNAEDEYTASMVSESTTFLVDINIYQHDITRVGLKLACQSQGAIAAVDALNGDPITHQLILV